MTEVKLVSKLGGNLFNPDRIFGTPSDQKSFLCGTLLGIATAIYEKYDKVKDETHQGFAGNFEFIDADPSAVGYKSGILYLPGGINEMLMDAVKAADGGQVQFVFEVYSERAENARKRAWSFKDLAPAAQIDPMAELRKHIPGQKAPVIEGPKDGGDKPEMGKRAK